MKDSLTQRSSKDKQKGLTLIEILIVIAIVSILSMVGTPIYQDYRTRAKVGTGVAMIAPIQRLLVEHYTLDGSWPTDNAEAGARAPNTYNANYLQNVAVAESPTLGSIVMTYDNSQLRMLGNNNTLIYYPVLDNNSVTWKCDAGTIKERYRPANCRT